MRSNKANPDIGSNNFFNSIPMSRSHSLWTKCRYNWHIFIKLVNSSFDHFGNTTWRWNIIERLDGFMKETPHSVDFFCHGFRIELLEETLKPWIWFCHEKIWSLPQRHEGLQSLDVILKFGIWSFFHSKKFFFDIEFRNKIWSFFKSSRNGLKFFDMLPNFSLTSGLDLIIRFW